MRRNTWAWLLGAVLVAGCGTSSEPALHSPPSYRLLHGPMMGDSGMGQPASGPGSFGPTQPMAPAPVTIPSESAPQGDEQWQSLGWDGRSAAQKGSVPFQRFGADSSAPGFPPRAAVDGNPNTHWASGVPHDTTATYVVELEQPQSIRSLTLKTGPTEGASYQVGVSSDGETWANVSQPIERSNSADNINGYGTYNVKLSGFAQLTEARFVRVKWYNPRGTADHAEIYTLKIHPSR